MFNPSDSMKPGDCLLLVDVQNDFCPGGALPIPDGDAVVPVINRWIDAARLKAVPVYASRDWHPLRHISFREEGGKWPQHCLADSPGAAFHPQLLLPDDTVKITKGVRFDKDQNSAFDETGFAVFLKREGIARLWIGGLAEDVCVLATVLDARREGFTVNVIAAAVRPVTPQGGRAAAAAMRTAGAMIIEEEPEERAA